jgi:hypothetical protein
MREPVVLYEAGDFFVTPAPGKGYEVWRKTITHSVRCAQIGSDGPKWLERAKQEANRRAMEAR